MNTFLHNLIQSNLGALKLQLLKSINALLNVQNGSLREMSEITSSALEGKSPVSGKGNRLQTLLLLKNHKLPPGGCLN